MKNIDVGTDRDLSGTPHGDAGSCSIPRGIAALAQP